MPYVDGYILAVPKKFVPFYRRMATAAGKVWRKHGALEFRECIGDDLNPKMAHNFPRALRLKRGETVFFSYVVFKSRADRDRVNAKVMKDPVIKKMMAQKMPFDSKRMCYGGFKVLVDA
jgi:uncharacterized protein YbaA (DUF1428 family)